MNTIKEWEEYLFNLHNDGVSEKSKHFNNELSKFCDFYKKQIKDKDKFMTNLIIQNNISECDKRIINYMYNNHFIIICTQKQLAKEVKMSAGYLFIRLCILESRDIIKSQIYERKKIIYITI